MRLFDQRFGVDFLAGVPTAPGVYRFLDAAGALLYVGKAGSLRRRLAQYRTAGRKKKERKRRALVKAAATITWEVCASDLAASLTEIRLIQTLRPRRNVASAFPFLYPYIGIRVDGRETFFCLTTGPEAFPSFELHGAFRSRDATGEAFHALARLLRFVGHPIPRARQRIIGAAAAVYSSAAAAVYSTVIGFRRLPVDASTGWSALLQGASRGALEALALELLEHPGATARRAEIQEDLAAVALFFESEALALARARAATGYSRYPVPQGDRDLLFAEARALRAAT
ncbi:MAG TPA: nucleotide excision repair endonuclease [Pseudomonadales bacterium]|nr:nucleotide excision repair endonuclease [Pseudomonadales bacterium]